MGRSAPGARRSPHQGPRRQGREPRDGTRRSPDPRLEPHDLGLQAGDRRQLRPHPRLGDAPRAHGERQPRRRRSQPLHRRVRMGARQGARRHLRSRIRDALGHGDPAGGGRARRGRKPPPLRPRRPPRGVRRRDRLPRAPPRGELRRRELHGLDLRHRNRPRRLREGAHALPRRHRPDEGRGRVPRRPDPPPEPPRGIPRGPGLRPQGRGRDLGLREHPRLRPGAPREPRMGARDRGPRARLDPRRRHHRGRPRRGRRNPRRTGDGRRRSRTGVGREVRRRTLRDPPPRRRRTRAPPRRPHRGRRIRTRQVPRAGRRRSIRGHRLRPLLRPVRPRTRADRRRRIPPRGPHPRHAAVELPPRDPRGRSPRGPRRRFRRHPQARAPGEAMRRTHRRVPVGRRSPEGGPRPRRRRRERPRQGPPHPRGRRARRPHRRRRHREALPLLGPEDADHGRDLGQERHRHHALGGPRPRRQGRRQLRLRARRPEVLGRVLRDPRRQRRLLHARARPAPRCGPLPPRRLGR